MTTKPNNADYFRPFRNSIDSFEEIVGGVSVRFMVCGNNIGWYATVKGEQYGTWGSLTENSASIEDLLTVFRDQVLRTIGGVTGKNIFSNLNRESL